MQTFVVRRPAVAAGAAGLDAVLERLRAVEDIGAGLAARWQHSYILREGGGGFGLLCLFTADGPHSLQQHAALARLPAPDILPVAATHVGRPFARTLVHLVRRRGCWAGPGDADAALAAARAAAEQRRPRETCWLSSHVVQEPDGRLGSLCLYQAIDAEALRVHAAEAGLAVDEITPVFGRIVVRDGVVPAA